VKEGKEEIMKGGRKKEICRGRKNKGRAKEGNKKQSRNKGI
jgi:hypothetical protein